MCGVSPQTHSHCCTPWLTDASQEGIDKKEKKMEQKEALQLWQVGQNCNHWPWLARKSKKKNNKKNFLRLQSHLINSRSNFAILTPTCAWCFWVFGVKKKKDAWNYNVYNMYLYRANIWRTALPFLGGGTCTLEKGSMTLMRFCSSRLSYSLARCVLMIGSSRSSALYSVRACSKHTAQPMSGQCSALSCYTQQQQWFCTINFNI